MSQNRNKLLDLFISNLSNAILHRILEKAIDLPEIANRYNKEIKNSLEIAKIYREEINPKTSPFPEKDFMEIKLRIIKKIKAELSIRISKGYNNIDLSSIESSVESALKEMNII